MMLGTYAIRNRVQEAGAIKRGSGMGAPATTRVSDADIYRALRTDLTRFATVLVGPHDAPDVLSTVILRVLKKRKLADLEDPRAYLFKAILNEARSHLRNRSRKMSLLNENSGPAVWQPSVHPDVVAAVTALPARQRAATFLVYWGGYSTGEAAQLMGVSRGTVGRYLHLARNRIEGALS
jgi:RNA polymerase sigma-70 factor (ECF subfamily)